MKNKTLINAIASALNKGRSANAYGVQLLDEQLDDVAGGAAESCTGMKCGTFSSPPASQAAA